MLEVWWLSQSTARAYHLQDRALGRILSLFGLCPPWYQAGAQWRRSAQPTLEIHCFMAWHSTVQWKQWGMKLEEKWRNRRAGLNFDTFGVSTMLFFEYRELLNSQNTKSWHQILLYIIFCKKRKIKMGFAERHVYIWQTMHWYILILVPKPRYSFGIRKCQTVPNYIIVLIVFSVLFCL